MAGVEGFVGRVLRQSGDHFVFQFELNRSEPTVTERIASVVGHLHGFKGLVSGIPLRFVGDWVRHPKRGRQFALHGWTPWAVDDHDISRFLTECIPHFDDAALVDGLVKAFHLLTYEKITEAPEVVLAAMPEGLRPSLETALLSWAELRAFSDLSVTLRNYDVSAGVIRAIRGRFGGAAGRLLVENPYRLVAVEGFDLAKAEALAIRMGIPRTDPRRFDGAVLWVLRTAAQQGHLSARRGDLADHLRGVLAARRIWGLSDADLHEGLMRAADRLAEAAVVKIDPEVGAYLPEYFLYEREGANKLARFLTPSKLDADLGSFLEAYERSNHIELSDAQRDALHKLVGTQVLVVTGLPGTGKTTVIRTIVRLFKQIGVSFALMAPTGIAAKRLSAVTGEEAATIHRAFRWDGASWEFNARNRYSIGAVIVDEMSMVDQELFYRLLDALDPSTILVLVGDDAQLPPVGPGNVLRELLTRSCVPHVRLTQIFRQSQQSAIVVAAHQVHKGQCPQLERRPLSDEFQFVTLTDEDKIVDLIVLMAAKLKARDANFQVLSPKYDGVVGVDNLNDRLREQLNPQDGTKREVKSGALHFRTGDRVMVVRNDYRLNVSNGDMGKIHQVENDSVLVRIHGVGPRASDEIVTIRRSALSHMLRLAYAITVHKAQGSEFDTVIMPIVRSQGRMLQRNLFYTAVTRARKKVWLIGDQSSVQRSVGNDKVVQRNTAFASALNAAVTSLLSAGP